MPYRPATEPKVTISFSWPGVTDEQAGPASRRGRPAYAADLGVGEVLDAERGTSIATPCPIAVTGPSRSSIRCTAAARLAGSAMSMTS